MATSQRPDIACFPINKSSSRSSKASATAFHIAVISHPSSWHAFLTSAAPRQHSQYLTDSAIPPSHHRSKSIPIFSPESTTELLKYPWPEPFPSSAFSTIGLDPSPIRPAFFAACFAASDFTAFRCNDVPSSPETPYTSHAKRLNSCNRPSI